MNTFDREAFGRRSFSEKRKASNGKNKEVVAKVKALREEMKLEGAGSGSAQLEADTGQYPPYPVPIGGCNAPLVMSDSNLTETPPAV